MADNRSEDEEARRKIEDIMGGGSSGDSGSREDPDDPASGSRAARSRAVLRGDQTSSPPSRTSPRPAPPERRSLGQQAPARTAGGDNTQLLFIVGGIILVGLLLVAIIFALATFSGGGAFNLFATDTPTATPTPIPTDTPTPTPTATPTLVAPTTLDLPPLTCIFEDSSTCQQYCNDSSNSSECQRARDYISAQDADPAFWFSCVSDTSGDNRGNPIRCLEDAWRANQNPEAQATPTAS